MSLAPQSLNGTIDPNNLHLYGYTPASGPAAAFIGIFGVAALVHIFYLFRLRQCFFIPMIMGCIMEAGGYYGRYWGHSGPNNFSAYVLQDLLLTPAPIFLGATMYMTLGRIIVALDSDRNHSLVRPTRLSKIFVLGDIVCFLVQITGIGMQCTTSTSIQSLGQKVTVAGLVIQILVFAYFILTIVVLHRRVKARPTHISCHTGIHWRRHIKVMYMASVFVTVRNIYRVAEYAEGSTGPIAGSEAYIYVFDAALMALLAWSFVIVHPGRLLRAIGRLNSYEQIEKSQLRNFELRS